MIKFGVTSPFKSTTSILNSFASGLSTLNSVLHIGTTIGVIPVLSGVLTADTYKEVLQITGSGVLNVLTVSTVDTTARTVGLKVVIDGVTVFDVTSSPSSLSGRGLSATGTYTGETVLVPIPFHKSISASIKSSLSETDKIQLNYMGYLT